MAIRIIRQCDGPNRKLRIYHNLDIHGAEYENGKEPGNDVER
jgi:hypothetical protein